MLPELNSVFNLPGQMLVVFQVESQYNIEFIRLSVDNADLVPIYGSKFFYPEDNATTIEYNYPLDVLSDEQNGPYYIHIAIDDGVKLTHTYQEIGFVNA